MMPFRVVCCWYASFIAGQDGMDDDPAVCADNEGAIFPTYDELQLQLASPEREKLPEKPSAGYC